MKMTHILLPPYPFGTRLHARSGVPFLSTIPPPATPLGVVGGSGVTVLCCRPSSSTDVTAGRFVGHGGSTGVFGRTGTRVGMACAWMYLRLSPDLAACRFRPNQLSSDPASPPHVLFTRTAGRC